MSDSIYFTRPEGMPFLDGTKVIEISSSGATRVLYDGTRAFSAYTLSDAKLKVQAGKWIELPKEEALQIIGGIGADIPTTTVEMVW